MSSHSPIRRGLLAGAATLLVCSFVGLPVANASPRASERATSDVVASRPRIDVVFVLDTTGSMSGLIEGAKRKIWSIASHLASGQPRPEIRMGLVAYRDRGDAYTTRRVELTDDVDAVYAELLQLEAQGGGDTPEAVNRALHEAVTSLAWSEGAGTYRVIFLVGDAPPHANDGDVPVLESARLAARRGIRVNTVQCGAHAGTTPIWRAVAGAAEGEYAAIRQDGGMVAMTTPLDDDLARLNRELAATALAWGKKEEQAELRAKLDRSLRAPESAAAARLSYLAKAGGSLNSGRRDLVDAVKDGEVALHEIAPEELPEELRALSPPERAALVEEREAKRSLLRGRIARLADERDVWVRTETERRAAAGEGDGFDRKVLGAIRTQAARAGIVYE